MDYGNSCCTLDPSPSSPISDAHRALNDAVDLSRRVGMMVDRLVGAVPLAGDAAEGTGPDAILPSLRDHSLSVAGHIREAQDALDRLERALP